MTVDKLRGLTRRLIGAPSVNTVPDVEIDQFLIPAIQWFAGMMKCMVIQDDNIGIVAEQRTYSLPPGLLYMTLVEVNGNLLEPTTTWSLNAGGDTTGSGVSGQTWLTATSGTPQKYTIEGRQLILYPPASAAFVTATPVMRWRYVGLGAEFGTQQNPGLGPQGIPALTDLDLAVVRYEAARAWLSAHLIGLTGDALAAQQAQIGAYQASISRDWPECKQRWMSSIADLGKRWRVSVDRAGGAR